ncbi:ribulose-phosphate 3-epimerase [Dehalobacter sp. TBBPA1]|uniref:ribulose-phosphate 3-epimerase n=1 Tax=Dehalobacter sp. TBBPA1 TaxID=3235037 RepID=UPI0034A16AB6
MALTIAPSILSANFARLEEDVSLVENAGIDMLHIDIMDGHFVPNISIGPAVVGSLRKVSALEFDVHLMIEHPEKYVEDFVKAGADSITIHAEATRHLHRVIQLIKSLGANVGVALNPATPLEMLTYVLQELDVVLLMTVNPGFGGQKFIQEVLPKIVALSGILKEVNPLCRIEVDGGINVETARLVSKAGAEILVAGAAVFSSPDPQQAIYDILEAAKEEQRDNKNKRFRGIKQ